MKSSIILFVCCAVFSYTAAFPGRQVQVKAAGLAAVRFSQCADVASVGTAVELNATNTNSDASGLLLPGPYPLPQRFNLKWIAGESHASSVPYKVTLNGTSGLIDLKSADGTEQGIEAGKDYNLGISLVVEGFVRPGAHVLRILRQPEGSAAEVCIEVAVEIENDDVEDPPCDPELCRLEGYCTSYRRCVKQEGSDLGKWETHDCGEDLFWNPDENNVHGGVCDYFVNLPAALQEQYKDDHTCILPCAWWQEGSEACSATYHYRVPFDNHTLQGRELTLSCPSAPAGEEPLVWNQNVLTCARCSDVLDTQGNTCCADTTTASVLLRH